MNTLMALVMVGMGALPTPMSNDRWFVDYARALEVAKSAEMPLLITIEQPGKSQVFPAPSVLTEAGSPLKGYVLCRVDGSTRYGAELARRFKATAYPFSAIVDKSGEFVLYKRHGAMKESELSSTLVQFKAGSAKGATTVVSSTVIQEWKPAPATSSILRLSDPNCLT